MRVMRRRKTIVAVFTCVAAILLMLAALSHFSKQPQGTITLHFQGITTNEAVSFVTRLFSITGLTTALLNLQCRCTAMACRPALSRTEKWVRQLA